MPKKLTIAEVELIRRRFRQGAGVRELARELKMNPGNISRIVNHKTWNGTKQERIEKLEREILALKRELETRNASG